MTFLLYLQFLYSCYGLFQMNFQLLYFRANTESTDVHLFQWLVVAAILLVGTGQSSAGEEVLLQGASVIFEEIERIPKKIRMNFSAIVEDEDGSLIIGSDEYDKDSKEDKLYKFKPIEHNVYKFSHSILVQKDKESELDIEGMARNNDELFIVGSHSRKRKKIEFEDEGDRRSQESNRERFFETVTEKSREQCFSISISTGKRLQKVNLRSFIADSNILSLFRKLPSKENGIDIEGLAVVKKKLYVGFRGPVLRHNFVPVLKLSPDRPQDGELLFVNLDGYGIRDMVSYKDGILILAGPMGDMPVDTYRLYFWNRKDQIYDEENAPKPKAVGRFKSPTDGKAEGLTLLKSGEILIVFDGIAGGNPMKFTVPVN